MTAVVKRTTPWGSNPQIRAQVACRSASTGERPELQLVTVHETLVLQLGRLELLGLALLRNLRDVVHEVAAAAACDGPTPPPPPRKKPRGVPPWGQRPVPLALGFPGRCAP